MKEITAYIGLGSNLADPIAQVQQGIQALASLAHCELQKHSQLYRSPPLPLPTPLEQPDFINAVVKIQTTLSSHALLIELQQIEIRHARQREIHWGPRTLDLDLLLYGNEIRQDAVLTLPHPQMTKRNFVLYPLAEIDPDLTFPDGTTLDQHLKKCLAHPLEILESESISVNDRSQ